MMNNEFSSLNPDDEAFLQNVDSLSNSMGSIWKDTIQEDENYNSPDSDFGFPETPNEPSSVLPHLSNEEILEILFGNNTEENISLEGIKEKMKNDSVTVEPLNIMCGLAERNKDLCLEISSLRFKGILSSYQLNIEFKGKMAKPSHSKRKKGQTSNNNKRTKLETQNPILFHAFFEISGTNGNPISYPEACWVTDHLETSIVQLTIPKLFIQLPKTAKQAGQDYLQIQLYLYSAQENLLFLGNSRIFFKNHTPKQKKSDNPLDIDNQLYSIIQFAKFRIPPDFLEKAISHESSHGISQRFSNMTQSWQYLATNSYDEFVQYQEKDRLTLRSFWEIRKRMSNTFKAQNKDILKSFTILIILVELAKTIVKNDFYMKRLQIYYDKLARTPDFLSRFISDPTSRADILNCIALESKFSFNQAMQFENIEASFHALVNTYPHIRQLVYFHRILVLSAFSDHVGELMTETTWKRIEIMMDQIEQHINFTTAKVYYSVIKSTAELLEVNDIKPKEIRTAVVRICGLLRVDTPHEAQRVKAWFNNPERESLILFLNNIGMWKDPSLGVQVEYAPRFFKVFLKKDNSVERALEKFEQICLFIASYFMKLRQDEMKWKKVSHNWEHRILYVSLHNLDPMATSLAIVEENVEEQCWRVKGSIANDNNKMEI